MGAVNGAISFGIGTFFDITQLSGTWLGEISRAATHGLVQGAMTAAQGGDFWAGFASGALTSGVGHGAKAMGLSGTPVTQLLTGGLTGGLGSVIMGGNFWQGVGSGLIVTGLNQLQHLEHYSTDKSKYSLRFDGEKLDVIDIKTGEVVYSTTATSGKGKHMNNSNSQNITDQGPIPEGEYSFKNSNWKTQTLARQAYNILIGNGDWGSQNVPLDVVDNNNSTRSGFYLHGGFSKGSAGCIDAGSNINRIYRLTIRQTTTIVTVQY